MQPFRWLVVLVSLSFACGDDGSPATSTTSPGSGSTEDTGSTLGATSTSASASDPSTGPTSAGSSVGDDATTSNSTGSSSADESESTGEVPSTRACEVDEDCVRIEDCCTCDALPVGVPAPACPEDSACLVSACTAQALPTRAVPRCLGGQCVLRTACDPTTVACRSLPPDCEAGTVPEVEGECWSGNCVAAADCDKVPSCDLCAEGQVCIEQELNAPGPLPVLCLPLSIACTEGEPTCACMAEACAPFECADAGEGLRCFCPVCG